MYMYMRLYIFAHKTEGLENEPTLYTYGCMHFRSRSAGVRQIHEHVYVRTRIICPTFKLANGSTTTIRQLRSLKISQSMLFLFPPSLVYTYECSQSASVCLSACSTYVCLSEAFLRCFEQVSSSCKQVRPFLLLLSASSALPAAGPGV